MPSKTLREESDENFREIQHQLELIRKDFQRLDDQEKRYFSNYESEERHRKENGDRLKLTEVLVQQILQKLEKIEATLYNGGKGMVLEVDRLKQDKERSKSSIAVWLAIASLAVAIGTFIANIF